MDNGYEIILIIIFIFWLLGRLFSSKKRTEEASDQNKGSEKKGSFWSDLLSEIDTPMKEKEAIEEPVYGETVCPTCNQVIQLDSQDVQEEKIVCPNCYEWVDLRSEPEKKPLASEQLETKRQPPQELPTDRKKPQFKETKGIDKPVEKQGRRSSLLPSAQADEKTEPRRRKMRKSVTAKPTFPTDYHDIRKSFLFMELLRPPVSQRPPDE